MWMYRIRYRGLIYQGIKSRSELFVQNFKQFHHNFGYREVSLYRDYTISWTTDGRSDSDQEYMHFVGSKIVISLSYKVNILSILCMDIRGQNLWISLEILLGKVFRANYKNF